MGNRFEAGRGHDEGTSPLGGLLHGACLPGGKIAALLPVFLRRFNGIAGDADGTIAQVSGGLVQIVPEVLRKMSG